MQSDTEFVQSLLDEWDGRKKTEHGTVIEAAFADMQRQRYPVCLSGEDRKRVYKFLKDNGIVPRAFDFNTDLDPNIRPTAYALELMYSGKTLQLTSRREPFRYGPYREIQIPQDLFKCGMAVVKEVNMAPFEINRTLNAAIPLDKEAVVRFNHAHELTHGEMSIMPILLDRLQLTRVIMDRPGKVVYHDLRPIDKLLVMANARPDGSILVHNTAFKLTYAYHEGLFSSLR